MTIPFQRAHNRNIFLFCADPATTNNWNRCLSTTSRCTSPNTGNLLEEAQQGLLLVSKGHDSPPWLAPGWSENWLGSGDHPTSKQTGQEEQQLEQQLHEQQQQQQEQQEKADGFPSFEASAPWRAHGDKKNM
jgi:hypothetical protein